MLLAALALGALGVMVERAWRRGAARARLYAGALILGALTLGAALLALALGAAQAATGRFLIGMGAGVALGLALGCAIIRLADRRAA